MENIIETINNFEFDNIKSKTNRLTSIIILTYNKLEYTKICIESIRKFTQKGTYEIIVVDNNSTDDTVSWLKEQSDLTVIYNKENFGFPKGCNQGIKIAKGDNILLLNNDTIVTPNWLYSLDKALWSSKKLGAVGAITNNSSYGQSIDIGNSSIEDVLNFCKEKNTYDKTLLENRLKLVGFCMLIKKEVMDKVGLLDEIFSPGNYEDDDLSFRIISKGYKLALFRGCFIYHFGSVSFSYTKNIKYRELMKTNRKKFKDKWGFDSDNKSEIKFYLVDEVNKNKDDKFNLLEIGCGVGATLSEVKHRYKNSKLYGLEPNSNSLKICSSVTNNTILGNIDNLDKTLNKNILDFVILSNTSPYINDLHENILKLNPYLKNGATIILDIENYYYIDTIIKLFKSNKFYDELQFFKIGDFIKSIINSNNYLLEKNISFIGNKSLTNYEKNIIKNLSIINGEEYNNSYEVCRYLLKLKYIDYNRYENDEFRKLKYTIMRIDNGYLKDDDIKYILNMYDKYKGEIKTDIKCLIDISTINKKIVIEKLINYKYDDLNFTNIKDYLSSILYEYN